MNSSLNKTYKYQLIFPQIGSKIYKTSSFDKAVKKCFDELKNYIAFDNKIDNFVILNIDTSELFKFQLDHPNLVPSKQKIKEEAQGDKSAEGDKSPDNKDIFIKVENADNNVNDANEGEKSISTKITELETRVEVLENLVLKRKSI